MALLVRLFLQLDARSREHSLTGRNREIAVGASPVQIATPAGRSIAGKNGPHRRILQFLADTVSRPVYNGGLTVSRQIKTGWQLQQI